MMIDYELWPHLSPSIVLILGKEKKNQFFSHLGSLVQSTWYQKIISVLNFNTTEFSMTNFHL